MAQCSQGKQRAPQRNPSSSQPDIKIRVDTVFRVRQRGQKVLEERMIAERGHRLIASDKHRAIAGAPGVADGCNIEIERCIHAGREGCHDRVRCGRTVPPA